MQRAIPLDSPLEWKQALSGIPHSFFHTWEHSYAMHLTHRLPAYLYCAESEGVRVVCPFIERPIGEYVDIATPYGFSGFAGHSRASAVLGAICSLARVCQRLHRPASALLSFRLY
jgi:hypothetical protein